MCQRAGFPLDTALNTLMPPLFWVITAGGGMGVGV